MSIYTQYADQVRDAHAEWDQAVDAVIDGTKQYADQVRKAIAVKPEPTAEAFDYLSRALDAQNDASKQLGAASVDFTVAVLGQWDALAQAARAYLGATQEILREHADVHYEEYARVVERTTLAFRPAPVATSAAAA